MLQSLPEQIESKKVSPPADQGGDHALSLHLAHQQPAGANFEGVDLTHILRFRAGRQPPSAALSTIAVSTSREPAYSVVDARGNEIGSWTWESLYDNADKINQVLITKAGLRKGDRVALVYRKVELLDFLAAFFGCLLAGVAAVPINDVEEIADMTFIFANSGAKLALTTESTHQNLTKNFAMTVRRLKREEARIKDKLCSEEKISPSTPREKSTVGWPSGVVWWKTDNLIRWKPKQEASSKLNHGKTKDTPAPCSRVDLSDLAYIEYTKTANGELKGMSVSQAVILEQCRFIGNSLTSPAGETFRDGAEGPNQSRRTVVMSWLEPRQQVGLIVGVWMGVYHGGHTVYLHSGATTRPGLWARCIARYGVTLAIGEYEGIKDLVKGASLSSTSPLESSFSSGDSNKRSKTENQPMPTLRRFLVDTTVIDPLLHRSFEQEVLSNLLKGPPNSIIGKVIIPMASLPEHGGMVFSVRGSSLSDSTTAAPSSEEDQSKSSRPCHFLLDREALKNNLVRIVAVAKEAIDRAQERGVVLVESSGLIPVQATILIMNPDTSARCEVDEVGEIWINVPSHESEFWNLPGLSKSSCHAQPSPAEVANPDQRGTAKAKDFLRTGLLGSSIDGSLIIFGSLSERILQEVQYSASQREKSLIEYSYFYRADIVNTVLRRIVGFTACIALDLIINGEHLPVICAETPGHVPQNKDATPKDVVRLSEYVIQAMHDYHGLRPYCVALATTGSLPRTRKHGKRVIHAALCRQLLEQGNLPLIHLHTAADQSLFHLTVGDDPLGGIWGHNPLVARQATLPAHTCRVQWSRCESPEQILDHRRHVDLAQFSNLAEVLVWRSLVTPEDIAYLVSSCATSPLITSEHSTDPTTLDKISSKTTRLLLKKRTKGVDIISYVSRRDSSDSNNTNNVLLEQLRSSDEFVPITFRQLSILVVRIATFLQKKSNFQAGDIVVLLFPNGIEFVATVYACWFLGIVPVPIQLPGDADKDERVQREDIVQLIGLLSELRLSHQPLLGSTETESFFKQQSTIAHIKACVGARQDTAVPIVLNLSKSARVGPNKILGKESGFIGLPKAVPSSATPQGVVPFQDAVVFAQYSTDGRRTLVKATHGTLMAQCKAQKVQLRLESIDPLVACCKSLSGLGFLQSCALSIYTGAPTTLIDYKEFLKAPRVYFGTLERHGVRDAILDYTMLERTLSSSTGPLSFNTTSVENLTLIPDKSKRSRVQVHQMFERHFCSTGSGSSWQTSSTVEQAGNQACPVNSMFSHMMNPMVSTRAYMNIKPVRLYLCLEALRQGRVVVLEKEKEGSTEMVGVWVEDSGIPVCGTTVAIVNPESRELCLSHEIGEIWVSSKANVQPYISKSPFTHAINTPTAANNFQAKLATDIANMAGSNDCSETTFARTGEVGFLWNYSRPDFNHGQATSLLFVLGPIGETFEVNGLLHFPQDVEETVEKSHPSIAHNGCIVFQAEQAIVCVVQTHEFTIGDDGAPCATVNLNMVLSVIHRVVESHQFVPDVIAVVAEGILAKDRDGAKQRGKTLSLFMSAKMPLLYIHYPKGSLVFTEAEAQSHQQRVTDSSIAPSLSRASSSSLTTSISVPTSNDEISSPFVAEDSTLADRRPFPLSVSISSRSQTSLIKKGERATSGLLTPTSPSTSGCGSTVQSKVMFYEATTAAAMAVTAAPFSPDSPGY